jgi:hypothetical protein
VDAGMQVRQLGLQTVAVIPPRSTMTGCSGLSNSGSATVASSA